MRLYLYINREYIKLLAPKVLNISYDIDFYEYSERHSCTVNDNIGVRPEVMFINEEKSPKKKIEIMKDNGQISNVEITKRYINIEDITHIKNNNLYFNIIENIKEDERIRLITGIIEKIENNIFYINNISIIYDKDINYQIEELFKHKCEIRCLVYRFNSTKNPTFISKLLCIYIE